MYNACFITYLTFLFFNDLFLFLFFYLLFYYHFLSFLYLLLVLIIKYYFHHYFICYCFSEQCWLLCMWKMKNSKKNMLLYCLINISLLINLWILVLIYLSWTAKKHTNSTVSRLLSQGFVSFYSLFGCSALKWSLQSPLLLFFLSIIFCFVIRFKSGKKKKTADECLKYPTETKASFPMVS